jgi:hypothetical protein
MMGYGYDPFLSERSLKPPVFHTSNFVFRSAQEGKQFFELAYGLRQKRARAFGRNEENPPILRWCAGVRLTLRWREVDSNFPFRCVRRS